MKHHDTGPWDVWIDTGGTFTDCLAQDPRGVIHRAKVLSSSSLRFIVRGVVSQQSIEVESEDGLPPDFFKGFDLRPLSNGGAAIRVVGSISQYTCTTLQLAGSAAIEGGNAVELQSPEEAPVLGIRLITRTAAGGALPRLRLRVATTRGTNALLQRRGNAPVFFVTKGFRDLIEIGNQQRPDLFALKIEKPAPLYSQVVEVGERMASDGTVHLALDEAHLHHAARALVNAGEINAAVAFAHSYKNMAHEVRAVRILREEGFRHVSSSSSLSPMIKFLDRAETAVVDAYVSPIMKSYLNNIATQIGPTCIASFHVMTSAGGLFKPELFRACDSLLSGPAGGTIGASRAGIDSGFTKLIAFDMGGTSTDVSRFDGGFDYVFEQRVGGARLTSPALAIESVAAGGGSICGVERGQAFVGPQSAGANPGPACYGAGGPLTITDVNLLLGRLDLDDFAIPLSVRDARARFKELLDGIGDHSSGEELLAGFVTIVNERMADAIRTISVRLGYDPSDHALVAFGGAGPQHACAVAELLGISIVVVPADAGLLSAKGLAGARIERFAERQILRKLKDCEVDLPSTLAGLEQQAIAAVSEEGILVECIKTVRRLYHVRLAGQESTLGIEPDSPNSIEAEFLRQYQARYGYIPRGRTLEIESIRVVAANVSEGEDPEFHTFPAVSTEPVRSVQMFLDGSSCNVPSVARNSIRQEECIQGPALIREAHCVTVVEPGWQLHVDANGSMIIRRTAGGTM